MNRKLAKNIKVIAAHNLKFIETKTETVTRLKTDQWWVCRDKELTEGQKVSLRLGRF